MQPGVYLQCLKLVAERDGLGPSELAPVAIADILALEQELGMQLPPAYEEFLTVVGVGEEHGGLGVWFHLDLGRTGNLLEVNESLAERHRLRLPENFLIFYESRGDAFYGFPSARKRRYSDEVYVLDPEEDKPQPFAADLGEFLEANTDCDEEEIQRAERRAEARGGRGR